MGGTGVMLDEVSKQEEDQNVVIKEEEENVTIKQEVEEQSSTEVQGKVGILGDRFTYLRKCCKILNT